MVRTPDFESGNPSSILGRTKEIGIFSLNNILLKARMSEWFLVTDTEGGGLKVKPKRDPL
jgi:hypothetical protein